MDQNCKLWVHSIWSKIQNFEGFLKHCVSLTGRLPLFKISAKSNNIYGSKGSKPSPPRSPHSFSKKGTISWMLNQYEKLRKFLTSQPKMLFWRILSQIYIWIRLFHFPISTIYQYFNKSRSISDVLSCILSLVKLTNLTTF